MLVDTGSWSNLSGGDAIKRQDQLAKRYGLRVKYTPMAKPKKVSGVGDNSKVCTNSARVPACLESGRVIEYDTPVIDGDPSPVPTLLGLDSMAQRNTYFGCANGLMAMIPEGTDDQIVWPQGTEFVQCKKAPSKHWLMTVSNWDKRKPETPNRHTEASFTNTVYPYPYPNAAYPPGLGPGSPS